jgi:hypothetical protein
MLIKKKKLYKRGNKANKLLKKFKYKDSNIFWKEK